MQDTLLKFGYRHVATVKMSGAVDIRLVDDSTQSTLTGRMSDEEFTAIAWHMFDKIRVAESTSQDDRDSAQEICDVIQRYKLGQSDSHKLRQSDSI